MWKKSYPLYLGNKPLTPNDELQVTDKYSGEVFTRVAMADETLIRAAIGIAAGAAPAMRKLAGYERRNILMRLHEGIALQASQFEEVLCLEAGKPRRDSRAEVARALDTVRTAAEESVRFGGEYLPLDISDRSRGYSAISKRVPVGPCSFISPFNFPFNLALHKIAPAIAVGCPFVLKPASFTPVSSILLGEILADIGLPDGAFSILPAAREASGLFSSDERLKLLSFTGSAAVGWKLKERSGKKKVVLELGGNAACVVDETCEWEKAVPQIVKGAYSYAGQSCISVQRVLVHRSIYDRFREKFVTEVKALKVGSPLEEDTIVGPMISEVEAMRLETWVAEAMESGAHLLCGGNRQRTVIQPAVMENVSEDTSLWKEEAFGPIALLAPFSQFEEALAKVNASRYGLQAGIFTNDIRRAYRAWNELEVGAVIIGGTPSFRVDSMPYGGVKDSGFGREGVRYAMEDMSEQRLMVVSENMAPLDERR